MGIELDGEYHDNENQKKLDQERTEILNLQNIRIIRFKNAEIQNQLETVLQKIKFELNSEI